jgi:hypothetical protein
MGYRSEVALCLSPAGETLLQQYLAEMQGSLPKQEFLDISNFFNAPADILKEDGSVLRYWKWYKWYDEYAEVQLANRVISELEDEEFLFLRVGDDHDDIEERGHYYESPFSSLCLVRQITY